MRCGLLKLEPRPSRPALAPSPSGWGFFACNALSESVGGTFPIALDSLEGFAVFPGPERLEDGPVLPNGFHYVFGVKMGQLEDISRHSRSPTKGEAGEYPAGLSGGQKQRVTLAMGPEVVLFDEPTSALDPELHEEVLQTMRQLARDSMTMIIVTYEVKFAREVADQVILMDGGVIVEEGSPAELFANPRHPLTRAFLRLVE